MNIGYDGGYSKIKAIMGNERTSFPSVVGTLDSAQLDLGNNARIAMLEPDGYLVGAGAVTQSASITRNESRNWAGSKDWRKLFLAALSELTTATSGDLNVVTGLPVKFLSDRERIVATLMGEHRFRRDGRRGQTLKVVSVKVIPQPFGSLLALALNDKGQLVNADIATGTVGVIDLGGKTCNILSVEKLADKPRESTSVNAGAWNVARKVGAWLAGEYPDLDLRDHRLMSAVINRQVDHFDETVDLTEVVNDAIAPIVQEIIGKCGELWNGAAHISQICITGGGALLFGDLLKSHWRHAHVVKDPIFANAIGYHKLAQR